MYIQVFTFWTTWFSAYKRVLLWPVYFQAAGTIEIIAIYNQVKAALYFAPNGGIKSHKGKRLLIDLILCIFSFSDCENCDL